MKKKLFLITGKIGSGKSTICNMLRKDNQIVVSVDDLMHLLYKDVELQGAMISLFGKDIYDKYGNPTPEFKAKVIADENAFKMVEKIVGSKLLTLVFHTIYNCVKYNENCSRIFLECGYPEKIYGALTDCTMPERGLDLEVKRVLVEADEASRKTKVAQRWIDRNQEFVKTTCSVTDIIQKSNEYVEQFEKYQKTFDPGDICYTIKNNYDNSINDEYDRFWTDCINGPVPTRLY